MEDPILQLIGTQTQWPARLQIIAPRSSPQTDNIRLQMVDVATRALVLNEAVPVGTFPAPYSFPGGANILSGEHEIQAFTERGNLRSAGSPVILHGNTTPPNITSPAAITVMEGLPVTFQATADQIVTWDVSGPDAGVVSIDPVTGAWSLGVTTSYYFGQRTYNFYLIATNRADRSTSQAYVVTITADPAHTPPPQWMGRTGHDKSAYLNVSGTPPLRAVNPGTVGNPGFVRTLGATAAAKFQVEHTIDSFQGYPKYQVIGVDDGTDDYSSYLFIGTPGTLHSVLLQYTNGYQAVYVHGGNVWEGSGPAAIGDTFGYRCTKDAGQDANGNPLSSIEFYAVSGGVLTPLHTVTFTPFGQFFPATGLFSDGAATSNIANFGASSYARALSDGYTGA